MAIEHADFEGVERLAAVTGGATASTFDHPELAVLGECKKIEEVRNWQGCREDASRVPLALIRRRDVDRAYSERRGVRWY